MVSCWNENNNLNHTYPFFIFTYFFKRKKKSRNTPYLLRKNSSGNYLNCDEDLRGYGGKCLPKDIRGFSTVFESSLIDDIIDYGIDNVIDYVIDDIINDLIDDVIDDIIDKIYFFLNAFCMILAMMLPGRKFLE